MVVAFSRGAGLLRGIAKGARRLGSNYAGGFEPLTLGDIVFSNAAWEKAARASESGGLVTITAWEVLELFPTGRQSLRSFLACCCILDLVQRGMQEADPHPGVFDALLVSLRELAPRGEPERALAHVAWALLHETGLAPDISHDIVRGAPLLPAKVYTFFPRLGGFVSAADAETTSAAPDAGPAWRVRSETLHVLRALAVPELALQAPQASRMGPLVWQRAASLLVQYFREVHQTDVPAVGQWLAAMRKEG